MKYNESLFKYLEDQIHGWMIRKIDVIKWKTFMGNYIQDRSLTLWHLIGLNYDATFTITDLGYS